MTRKVPFGRRMREDHFQFSPSYTPLNHGSFGAFPRVVQERQTELQKLAAERPDTFIVFDLPNYIDQSREAVAPLLGVPVDEVVLVPNATTGINTVLRNLNFESHDVIVHFSTIYPACEKTIASVGEHTPLTAVKIGLEYPIEDDEIVKIFKETVNQVRDGGQNVKIAMFDTILTFPGVRFPWEMIVLACKELGILSLIDGAHGIGSIDLTHVGSVAPDFFVSNCHNYPYEKSPSPDGKTPFVHLFEFVATTDYTPYVCIPAALKFRKELCGGEAAIMKYSWELARIGGDRTAEILGTEVLENKAGTLRKCFFANVKLPLVFKAAGEEKQQGDFDVEEAPAIQKWINATAFKEFDTYLQVAFVYGHIWVRLSAQTYLEVRDFEWVGYRLKELCARLRNGELRGC
ncbi:hypothetical protein BP5796_10084 [Coleophoma crateriformis]|uniref:Aminotransferase class V domain-containing protein n=1 Tax=Coleophoma crateriformis TaxID=565419 RepID=A0A3D8QUG2_9HELO|nr:hypothetical protein BP5796_10084 [Coleophoma crateriformis]